MPCAPLSATSSQSAVLPGLCAVLPSDLEIHAAPLNDTTSSFTYVVPELYAPFQTPISPGAPWSPLSPFRPCGPAGPAGPAGPVAPVSPFGPAGPCEPAEPVGPL